MRKRERNRIILNDLGNDSEADWKYQGPLVDRIAELLFVTRAISLEELIEIKKWLREKMNPERHGDPGVFWFNPVSRRSRLRYENPDGRYYQ
jgi:hypothetical protein